MDGKYEGSRISCVGSQLGKLGKSVPYNNDVKRLVGLIRSWQEGIDYGLRRRESEREASIAEI